MNHLAHYPRVDLGSNHLDLKYVNFVLLDLLAYEPYDSKHLQTRT